MALPPTRYLHVKAGHLIKANATASILLDLNMLVSMELVVWHYTLLAGSRTNRQPRDAKSANRLALMHTEKACQCLASHIRRRRDQTAPKQREILLKLRNQNFPWRQRYAKYQLKVVESAGMAPIRSLTWLAVLAKRKGTFV